MRVGVIGAGVAGLSTAKVLLAAGHEVVVFDRTPDVGGVWSRTRRYPGILAPLRACGPCSTDFEGLLAVLEDEPGR